MYKYIKKIITTITIVLSLASSNVMAMETNNVKDYLGYLNEEEVISIQKEIDYIKEEHGLDTVIVITDDVENKSSMAYADDFYDYNGYGVGENKSGTLLLINMADREVWMSTTGDAIFLFSDNRIDKIIESATEDLSREYYNETIGGYLENINKYADYNFFSAIIEFVSNIFFWIAVLFGSTFITGIYVFNSQYNSTVTKDTYLSSDGFKLINKRDMFIKKVVNKKPKPKDNDSSTHSGSSGRSHGGGGGKF